jgi:hypothetical protein
VTLVILNKPGDVDWNFWKTLQYYPTVKSLNKFVDTFVKDKSHKIYKQIQKLPKQEQLAIKMFDKDVTRKLLKITKIYDQSHEKLFNGKWDINDLLNIISNLILWLSHAKDIYTIARMLHYMKQSKLIMSYDGDYHKRQHELFFTQYLPGGQTIYTYQSKKRCVTIPRNEAKTVFWI